MVKELKCPLCEEELYSGLGAGCKMCGMPLKEETAPPGVPQNTWGIDFCSDICEKNFKKINNTGGKK